MWLLLIKKRVKSHDKKNPSFPTLAETAISNVAISIQMGVQQQKWWQATCFF